jgi:hypothetical protein
MGSTAGLGLYNSAEQRKSCYKCGSKRTIKLQGKQVNIECRIFNQDGDAAETLLAAELTDLNDLGDGFGLSRVAPIGVDTIEFRPEDQMQFKVGSEGTGGLSKYQCGHDYQMPEWKMHQKLGFTQRLYIHYKDCANNYIGTMLQDAFFPNDNYNDNRNPNYIATTDKLQNAARVAMSEAIHFTDIVGVFKGSNTKAAHYDGILAQAYWAFTQNAYVHSVEFTIDETCLMDGSYLHAKYVGFQIDLKFDSTIPSNPSAKTYATYSEIYNALVAWLNGKVRTEGGKKLVDASRNVSNIIVTSRFTERSVELMMTVDENATLTDWTEDCVLKCVSYKTLQGVMPIDERPYLVPFQRYTRDNILTELPNDIFSAKNNFQTSNIPKGSKLALFIDQNVWDMYMQADIVSNDSQRTKQNIDQIFSVYPLEALSDLGGTGLWFITTVAKNPRLRNVLHYVDQNRPTLSPTFIGINEKCSEVEVNYDQLHGVGVRDFRIFGSNLLCSPFADNLQKPQEYVQMMLPCYNKSVRENMMHPQSNTNCNLAARFRKVAEYQNGALYALPLPNPADGYQILTLEAGDTAPAGALPVFEIAFEDMTQGIPAGSTATYLYTVTTSGGAVFTYTAQNPIIQYVGAAAGTTFNISQVVTLVNCTSTYVASQSYGENFPFVLSGVCADVDLVFTGRIDYTKVYVVPPTNAIWNTTVVLGVGGPIDLSANPDPNDAVAAAVIINQYFLDNAIVGAIAEGNANEIAIYSPNVSIVNVGGTAAVREYQLSIFDNTNYDFEDGLDTIEVREYCANVAAPVAPTFTSLVTGEPIASCGAFGWKVDLVIKTKAGCTFNVTATIANFVTDTPSSFTFA